MKGRDGNEWRMVPADATEDMLVAGLSDCDPIGSLIDWDDSKGECITRKTVADVYKAAIAAAPQFVAGEADDALCERIGRDCAEVIVNVVIMHAPARLPIDYAAFGAGMIAAVRSELGPALGLVTREEMARSVEIRDTEIARLETDLELARRDHASSLRLVADIRFALGDDGRRMQHELVEYCKELRRDWDRLDWLKGRVSGKEFRRIGIVYGEPAEIRGKIDAARAGNGGGV